MASKTLYPIYITSHDEYEGNILSANGTGEARWLIDTGDKTRDIGIIAFDTKLTNLSKACSINAYRVFFSQKHANLFAAECDWVLTPKLITNAYTSGDIINVYSSADYGSQGKITNSDLSWTDESVTFFSGWEDYQLAGFDGRYIGFHLKMQRDSSTLNLREYMSDLRATVDYTPRYYANFYNEDGTIIKSQTLNGGSSPMAPELSSKEGYDFLGWKSGDVVYSDELPASTETDLNFTAIYRKKPVITIESSQGGTVEPCGVIQCEYGSSLTLKLTPESFFYYVRNIAIDSVTQEDVAEPDEYLISNITEDHKVVVDFSKKCIISFSSYDNGTIQLQTADQRLNWSGLWTPEKNGGGYLFKEAYYLNFRVFANPDIGYEITKCVRKIHNPDYHGTGESRDFEMPYEDGTTIGISDEWEHHFDIKFEKIKFPINLTTDGNGSIGGSETIPYEESETYKIIPNEHYIVKDVFLDGVSVLNDIVYKNSVAQITISDVTEEHSLEATFQRVVYLNFDAELNGTIEGTNVVNYGDNTSVTISANEGYSIDKVYINGEEVFSAALVQSSLYIPFENLTEDKTIEATFTNAIYSFNIVQSEEGGYITSSKVGNYVAGSEIFLEATAYTGWYFSSWSFGGNESKTTFKISNDTEVRANFEKYAYTIETTPGANGRIIPESVSANYGDTVIFNAEPDSGYVLSQWDDGSVNPKRTVAVTENATISAMFVKGYYQIEVLTEEGGTVEGSGVYEYQCEVQIKAQPKAGYYFVEWDDGSVIPERTIIVPAGGGRYIAKFERFKYNIDIRCSIGGTATESQEVKYGEALSIEITSDIGHKISNITVDGESVYEMLTTTKDGGRYLLTEIKTDHIVDVFFKKKRYIHTRKLLDYYPPVVKNILDFQELTKSQETLVGQVWDAVSLAWDNQFIDEATEEGVSNWETDYSLVPSKSDTLKQRKQRLKSKWVPSNKYTFEWLNSWLKTACGDKKFTEAKLEDYTVKTYLPISCNYTNILTDMREYIPSNMVISPTLQLNELEQKLYTGIAFRMKVVEKLESDKIEVVENAN